MAFVHKIRQVQLVGPKIRKLRKERKLTQTELASRIGIQQSDLSRMEKGEYRVSLDTLFKILAEFNLSIGEFFEDVARESFTPRDVQLVRELKQLPNDARREVEAFVAFKCAQLEGEDDEAAEPVAAPQQRSQSG
ncbi:MAG: XRE family transcriptional regulator [Acidobacteria bacterium]|nr:MAG: XRE family transcriptional regulator [Acidobacteriota bacterium]